MRRDIASWCRQCLCCATRSVGKQAHPPPTLVPVSGPFDRVGVYAVPDQTAPTIARQFVEKFMSHHGVPRQLLLYRRLAFLSKLMYEICRQLRVDKINTTAYHPQGGGLIEWLNRTLLDMFSKSVVSSAHEWDVQLPYVLFAYQCAPQSSNKQSYFFLLYGCKPRLHSTLTPCSTGGGFTG